MRLSQAIGREKLFQKRETNRSFKLQITADVGAANCSTTEESLGAAGSAMLTALE